MREQTFDIPLPQQKASFVCLAQFCDWSDACPSSALCENFVKPGEEDVDTLGVRLADAVLVYADDSETTFPIRRRFEVSSPSVSWGQLCFGAVAHRADMARSLNDPLAHATDWGDLQTGVTDNSYDRGTLWICALPNPHPDRALKLLRLRGAGRSRVVCGLTLFHGSEHPLRYQRLSLCLWVSYISAGRRWLRWNAITTLEFDYESDTPPRAVGPGTWIGPSINSIHSCHVAPDGLQKVQAARRSYR